MAALASDSVPAEWLSAFEPLARQGKIRCDMTEPGHSDGWGLVGYFRSRIPEYLERQPGSLAQEHELFQKAAQWVEQNRAPAAMLHLRKSTEGGRSIANTHPFLHGEWAFCHNGTIYESERIPLKKLNPAGATDSERFFLYLMEALRWPFSPRRRLEKALAELKKNFKYSSLTFLLTNGKELYAYRDCDPQFDEYYTLYSAKTPAGQIVSSEPLGAVSTHWTRFANPSLTLLS